MPCRLSISIILAAMLANHVTSANSTSLQTGQTNVSTIQPIRPARQKDISSCLDYVFVDVGDDYCADDNEPEDLLINKNNSSSNIIKRKNADKAEHGANVVIETETTTVNIELQQKGENRSKVMGKSTAPDPIGFYVIVVHAEPEQKMYMPLVDSTARCLGLHPNLGRTQPSTGSLHAFAHVAYFGPYATGQQALDRRNSVRRCVKNAYIGTGIIEGY